jgi:putative DNA primase/helicase
MKAGLILEQIQSNEADLERQQGLSLRYPNSNENLAQATGVIILDGDARASVPARRIVFPCTDSGNAEMFAAIHGESLLFDHKAGRWLLWDGQHQRWVEDKENKVRGLMKNAARARGKYASQTENAGQQYAWARNSESRARIDSALELAKSEVPISDLGEGWDGDPWLLGLANGVVDLQTGQFRSGTRRDRLTKYSPVTFDPNAKCPRFEAFVAEIFSGERALVDYVQKAVGYSLTGSVDEQCLFACHGDGRNGKSTFLEVILHILGDYAIDLPFSILEAKAFGNPPGEGVNLPGTRFAKVVEIREGKKLDEARLKSWTGGDTMTVRPLYRDSFSFHPMHKLWLAFNHRPVISDNSPAMWRRIKLIPFLQKFEGAQRDSGLLDKLKAEAPGIINWALEGCRRWQREGLQMPAQVNAATKEYQDESDVITPFIEECCAIDRAKRVPSADLWAAYLVWTSEARSHAVARTVFADHFKRHGFRPVEVGHNKTWMWQGLGLKSKVAEVRVDAGAL